MNKYRLLIGLSALVIITMACGLQGGSGGTGTGGSGSGSNAYNTKFPLPANVSNFTDLGNNSINFQTTLSLTDTISFYRDSFKKAGLTERTANTAITATTFSLVFDGDPSGEAIVVQGVDLGNGKTNVNIRYEKV
jgi:hypothetical protein